MAKEHTCRCGRTILIEGVNSQNPDGSWTCHLCPPHEGDEVYGLGHIVLVYKGGSFVKKDNGGSPPQMSYFP